MVSDSTLTEYAVRSTLLHSLKPVSFHHLGEMRALPDHVGSWVVSVTEAIASGSGFSPRRPPLNGIGYARDRLQGDTLRSEVLMRRTRSSDALRARTSSLSDSVAQRNAAAMHVWQSMHFVRRAIH